MGEVWLMGRLLTSLGWVRGELESVQKGLFRILNGPVADGPSPASTTRST
jgi:hypothetical protein